MKLSKKFKNILGPGFLIAATGVGAGDMIAATVAGAKYGHVILWACIVGALIKYVLNEGIARWQLATGATLLEGWVHKFHNAISIYFISYLTIWSFIVAAALIAACGLAAHSIFPQLSIPVWGILHALLAMILVFVGKYRFLELLMKLMIGIMFSTIIINLFLIDINWKELFFSIIIPRIPDGSMTLLLGVIGGVGGSVTMLCYNYWLKEKKWNVISKRNAIKLDLKIAYFLTGLFGMAIIVIASKVDPEQASGSKIIISLANKLQETVGYYGKWIFLIGFWGAVFSSMLGVWNGIPYLFNDLITSWKSKKQIAKEHKIPIGIKSKYYRFFLIYLAIPPMLLLFLDKPVWIIILYAVASAFFMPFLAALLLVMNNTKSWVQYFKNKWYTNIILAVSIILFLYLMYLEIQKFI